MKRVFICLLSALLVTSFVSCSDDEDSVNDAISGTEDSTGGEEDDSDSSSSSDWTTIVANPTAWDGVKRAAITYQALVYSFADSDGDDIGDLPGVTSKLDYMDELGVSAIWLSPIHPSTSYHGYDVEDYSAVNDDFGTETDLQTLITTAKNRDIKIYLDYVLNHSAYEHPWFQDARTNGESSDYWDFYAFSKDPEADIAAGNIAQITTEGSAGYDSGQWFSSDSDAGASGAYKFVLDWTGTNPTITVTEAADADIDDDNPDTSTSGAKYLYYGDGVCKKFYDNGDNTYYLTANLDTDWGFLIRTSSTAWTAGTKYGAYNSSTILTLGEPLTLYPSTASYDPANIQFSTSWMYHSHFWTSYFADFNYGAADEADQSGAFKALTECADKWVNMGIGGFRLDAVKHIYHNATNSENPTFLAKFYDRMNETYKALGNSDDIYMVGENLSEAASVAPYYAGLPALFEFSFWYRLDWAINNKTGRYFASNIIEYQDLYSAYRTDYIEATKLSNHDESRTGSELGKDLSKMKLAGAVLLTAGGEPYIYQGEELGYWGTQDNGDEYVRGPILWDAAGSEFADGYLNGKTDASMYTSSISVETQEADESSILNVYRAFAQLRNTYPALATGKMTEHDVYNSSNSTFNQVACWYMVSGTDKALVVHNFGSTTVTLPFDDDLSNPIGVQGTAKLSADGGTLLLGSYSSAVFDLN